MSSSRISSSPWPPIGTFLFTEFPSLMLTFELMLAGFVELGVYFIALQLITLLCMLKVLTTNPGILPQIIYKYMVNDSDVSTKRIYSRFPQGPIERSIDTSSLRGTYCTPKNIAVSAIFIDRSVQFTVQLVITAWRDMTITVLGCRSALVSTTTSRTMII